MKDFSDIEIGRIKEKYDFYIENFKKNFSDKEGIEMLLIMNIFLLERMSELNHRTSSLEGKDLNLFKLMNLGGHRPPLN